MFKGPLGKPKRDSTTRHGRDIPVDGKKKKKIHKADAYTSPGLGSGSQDYQLHFFFFFFIPTPNFTSLPGDMEFRKRKKISQMKKGPKP